MKDSSALKDVVLNILATPGVEIKAIAIVKVYISEQQGNAWEGTPLTGPAAIVYNPKEKSSFIYVCDVEENSVGLSQEVYESFPYDPLVDFFHTFEMDDCVAGFSFAHTSEATTFLQAVKFSTPVPQAAKPVPKPSLPPRPAIPVPPTPTSAPSSGPTPPPAAYAAPPPPVTVAPPPKEPPPAPVESPAPQTPETPKDTKAKEKKKPSFFKKLADVITGNDIPEDFEVSDPRGFRHESHIGWDPERGFEIRNIPPEWRKLFAAAGIKKNELRDADTARFVMNVIGETVAGSGPPRPPTTTTAPPPTASTPAPPPPPPPAVPTHGAPPPPPAAPAPPPPPGKSAPPPPVSKAPPPPAKPTTAKPAVSGGRNDLLKSIQKGKELKKVDTDSLPDLKAMNAGQSNNLVNTLASAMAMRRGAMQIREQEEEEDEQDNWSD